MKKPKYKYVHGVMCLNCNTKIWSAHVHDFQTCKCESIFIDGGKQYTRTGWDPAGRPPVNVKFRVSYRLWLKSDRFKV